MWRGFNIPLPPVQSPAEMWICLRETKQAINDYIFFLPPNCPSFADRQIWYKFEGFEIQVISEKKKNQELLNKNNFKQFPQIYTPKLSAGETLLVLILLVCGLLTRDPKFS